MPDAPVPAEGAPEEGGGGITQALVETDKSLFKISQLVGQNPEVPDEVKAAFQASLDAFRQGLESLTGGGSGSAPVPANASPEQGASGAQPMSMQRPQ